MVELINPFASRRQEIPLGKSKSKFATTASKTGYTSGYAESSSSSSSSSSTSTARRSKASSSSSGNIDAQSPSSPSSSSSTQHPATSASASDSSSDSDSRGSSGSAGDVLNKDGQQSRQLLNLADGYGIYDIAGTGSSVR